MKPKDLIYLDNNATTRVDPAVVDAMSPYWSEHFLNPASVASQFCTDPDPITEAKAALALHLGAAPENYVLTSGATESNNWVIQGTANRIIREFGECHMVVSSIEHPSVLETAQMLQDLNHKVQLDLIPVDSQGVIDLDALRSILRPETCLVSVMLANNESGVIQPIPAAAQIVRSLTQNCLIHTDATQAVGKIEVDLDGDLSGADFLSLSAHKFHGPKGVGALFIRSGCKLDPWMIGGSQQDGRRAGTENPAGAMGLAAAIKLICPADDRTKMIRDQLELLLFEKCPKVQILGKNAARLPNTTLLLLPGIEGEMIVHQLMEVGIATSTGSACSNGSDRPSHVVTAMGIGFSEARNALRISLSRFTTIDEAKFFVRSLHDLIYTK